jgi:hypothetical protein
MTDLKIGRDTGQSGGTALTADLTGTFQRKDGSFQNPFNPIPAQALPTPAQGVSAFSGAGGTSTAAAAASVSSLPLAVSATGLMVAQGGVVPGSILTAASNLNTFTSEAQLAGLSIPANDPVPGATYYMKLGGVFGCTGTPTFAFGLRYGGAAGTSIAAIAAITQGGTLTAAPWEAECVLTFWSAILATGFIRLGLGTSAATGALSPFAGSAAAAGVAVVTTSAKVMSFTVTCGTSNAANTISALTGYGMRLA